MSGPDKVMRCASALQIACIAAAIVTSVPAVAQDPLSGLLNDAKREAQRTLEAARRRAGQAGPASAATIPTVAPNGAAAGHPELAGLGAPTMVAQNGQWITVPGPAPDRRPSCVQFRVFSNQMESNEPTVRLEARNNCPHPMDVLPIYHVRFLPNPNRNPRAAIDHFPGGRRFVQPGQTGEMVPVGTQPGYSELRRFWISAQTFNETRHYRRGGPAPCYHVNWRSGVIGDCGPGFAVPLPAGAPVAAADNMGEQPLGNRAAAPRGRITWRHIPLPKGVAVSGISDCGKGIGLDPTCKRGPTDSRSFNEMIGPFVDLKRWGAQGVHLGMTSSWGAQTRQVAPDQSWVLELEHVGQGKRPPLIAAIRFFQNPVTGRAFDHEGAIADLIRRFGQPVQREEIGNNIRPLESETQLLFAADPRFPERAGIGRAMNALRQRCSEEIMARTKSHLVVARGEAGIIDIEWTPDRAEKIRETCPSVLDDFLQIQEAALEPRLRAFVRRNGEIKLYFTYTRPRAALEMGQREIFAERWVAQPPGRINLGQ